MLNWADFLAQCRLCKLATTYEFMNGKPWITHNHTVIHRHRYNIKYCIQIQELIVCFKMANLFHIYKGRHTVRIIMRHAIGNGCSQKHKRASLNLISLWRWIPDRQICRLCICVSTFSLNEYKVGAHTPPICSILVINEMEQLDSHSVSAWLLIDLIGYHRAMCDETCEDIMLIFNDYNYVCV